MGEPRDVLVVEDDPDMLDAIQVALDHGGYPSRSAANGKQALDAVQERMPRLILLDMLMPVMDGWQFAQELHARHGETIPIVVMTAPDHLRARTEEIGAQEVLPKPFDLNRLLRVVARYV
jgi:CheY-like chemotaxis protein